MHTSRLKQTTDTQIMSRPFKDIALNLRAIMQAFVWKKSVHVYTIQSLGTYYQKILLLGVNNDVLSLKRVQERHQDDRTLLLRAFDTDGLILFGTLRQVHLEPCVRLETLSGFRITTVLISCL